MNFDINAKLKTVEVEFDTNVDTTLFNNQSYQRIRNEGLPLTDLSLLHYASIHFQSRHGNHVSDMYKNALLEVGPSFMNLNNDHFYFNGNEEPELQKQTTEVLGVGFGLALSHALFDVNYKCMNKLPVNGRQKRADYELIKNNQRAAIIELRGRKKETKSCLTQIIQKKAVYPQNLPKYGIVSRIPRNGDPTNLHVTDPQIELQQIDTNYIKVMLLNHYARVSKLAGFWDVGYSLNDKIIGLTKAMDETESKKISSKENKQDEDKVISSVTIDKNKYEIVFSNEIRRGVKLPIMENKYIVFGLDTKLLKLLTSLDLDKLLTYTGVNWCSDSVSSLDNGTFLSIVDEKELILKML